MSASTPTDETDSTNSKPMLMSVITPQSGPNGTTAKTTKAAATEMNGAKKKMYGSALSGRRSSFVSNLIASAMGCNRPYGPTRIGPRRACMKAEIFRSRYDAYKAQTATPVTTAPICMNGQTT